MTLTPTDNSWTPGSNPTKSYNPIAHNLENSNPVPQTGGANVTVALSVTNNDDLNNPIPRTNQQRIIPDAVKGRFINPVTDIPSVSTLSAVVQSGSSAIVTSTLTNVRSDLVVITPFYQIYIDQINPDFRMPESISSLNFPFFTWNSLYDHDGNSVVNQSGKSVSKLQVRNNSASDHLIIVEIYVRIIQNGSSATSG